MMTGTRSASWDKLNTIRRQRRVRNFVTLGLVALGPVLAVLTYIGLGPAEIDPTSRGMRAILLADLIYAIVVATLIMQTVARLIAQRRAKSAGSQLHLRLTGVFALVALLPTVLVAIFAVITLNFGLEGWFSDRVRNVLGTSLSAAQAYEQEQRRDLSADALRLADLMSDEQRTIDFIQDSDLRPMLSAAQAQIQRGLKEAYVIDGSGALRARGERSYLFGFERPQADVVEAAQTDVPMVIEDWSNNEFRAIVRLAGDIDRYLYVSRTVDGEILSLLDETQETVRLYEQLENDRGRLLFEFGLIYLGFAVIMILAAIWLGMWFAERLSRPVGRLAGAAQRVGAGDLDVQVIEAKGDDEIAMLGRLFNQMTRQLKMQRDALVNNTEVVERRRRLFDSVLSSVTAGVIGLDADGGVTFLNKAARSLLALPDATEPGNLSEITPEFVDLFDEVHSGGKPSAQQEIKITRRGKLESLLVRIAVRKTESGAPEGYVIAFDDVSELVSAQKMAAWGDVARRIAHEIKNPLTPIQLSAERLRRKFAPVAGDDLDSLNQYTDVIIRQTTDLRHIVDEFSKFARMPDPERREADIVKLLRDAVSLQRTGQPDVVIDFVTDAEIYNMEIDQTLIGQAMTNLIKNAGEATQSYVEAHGGADYAPRVLVRLVTHADGVEIKIADNGIGLPEDRTRLLEPYVTTRSGGTGLGLPIVKKIIEEHGGSLMLQDAEPMQDGAHRGAEAAVILPLLKAVAIPRDQLKRHVA